MKCVNVVFYKLDSARKVTYSSACIIPDNEVMGVILEPGCPSVRLAVDAIVIGLLLLQFCFNFFESCYEVLWPYWILSDCYYMSYCPCFVWTVRFYELSKMFFFVFAKSPASYHIFLILSGLLPQFCFRFVETFMKPYNHDNLLTWDFHYGQTYITSLQ